MDDLLRHTVATVAYRANKALQNAPAEFAHFQVQPGGRTPIEILAHMGDLFDWALSLADGKHKWHEAPPLPWDQEVTRFHAALHAFDQRLSSGEPLGYPAAQLFQGPIADALTHIGQIAMLRRLADCKIRGENYFKAEITIGRVGADQATPVVEF
ncbi:MAG TPA: hypothetical protein VKU19_07065 [Bryobacteraceae bacterium]|nr:hypothetical protein [Bryobacteraceae bacterium]